MTSRVLALFVLLAATMCQHSAAQSIEPIDSKHIYADADLVLVFQIKRLEQHLEPESKTKLEGIHQWLLQTTRIDSTNCNEVIVQFGGDNYENPHRMERHLGFVFRGENEILQQQIDEMLTIAPFEEETHNEKTFYAAGSEPGLYFSDNSLLIAERQRVRSFIDSQADAMGDRDIAVLQNVNRNLDVCAHVDLTDENFCDAFRRMMSVMGELRESDTLDKLINNADSATLQVDLEAMVPVRVEFAASNSTDLDVLQEAAGEFVAAAKDYVGELKENMSGEPGELTRTGEAFCNTLATLVESAEVTRDGDGVTITIDRNDESKQAINDFVNMMSAVVDVFGG